MESEEPGHEEYRYNIGPIEHDPFILISYLSAKYEEFTFEQVKPELGISTRQVSRDKNSALAKMLKRMKSAGYESYAEAAGAFLQESDYIPTQMETQNSIMKKRTGAVRLPSDHKMKK